jgi:hypothetical protein
MIDGGPLARRARTVQLGELLLDVSRLLARSRRTPVPVAVGVEVP